LRAISFLIFLKKKWK